ncbi:MAG: exopolyphosphatase [Ferruginibacter sp.]
MRLATIDVGSNAVRLMITEVTSDEMAQPNIKNINWIRVPLRLGFDVFNTGSISEAKQQILLDTMIGFEHLMRAHGVEHHMACATSAMRDASNGEAICDYIRKQTGIQLQVISGDREADLIYENHIAEELNKAHDYIYLDVGGGSTEVSVYSNAVLHYKRSFNIGTIRMLTKQTTDAEWDFMKQEIRRATRGCHEPICIGSGGNINKAYSISKKKDGKTLQLEFLRSLYKELISVSIEDRMKQYNMREDRADVIIPALQIYTSVMRWAGADEILVPKIGLTDGLTRHLWKHIQKKSDRGMLNSIY